MLPDDRDFGPAMARLTQRQRIFVDLCSAASSRLRRRVEPATAIAGTLRTGPHDRGNLLRQNNTQRELRRAIYHLGERRGAELGTDNAFDRPGIASVSRSRLAPANTESIMGPDDLPSL
jgi:hypothetical protein